MYTEFNCSYNQLQLWTHLKFNPESISYNLILNFICKTDIDIALLQKAVEHIVQRHESMRTTYKVDDKGQVKQCVWDKLEIPCQIVDASQMNLDSLKAHANKQGMILYDLENGPLMRLCFYEKYQGKHTVFLMCLPHIYWDAWSVGVFFGELTTIYSALKANQPIPLNPLNKQYKELMFWQESFVASDLGLKQLHYWEQTLKNLTPLELPTAIKNPVRRVYQGDAISFALTGDLISAIRKNISEINATFSKSNPREKITLHMYLLAAYLIMLHRITGVSDIAVNIPTPGRLRDDGERRKLDFSENIGYFINPSIFRVEISPQDSFSGLLQNVLRRTLSDRENQDFPLLTLIEKIKAEVPEIGFNFVRKRPGDVRDTLPLIFEMPNPWVVHLADNFIIEGVPSPQQSDLMDLGCIFVETEKDVHGTFNFRSDVLNKQQAQNLVGHFFEILKQVTLNINHKIAKIPLLTTAEKLQISKWNQTEREFPTEKTLHQLFEEQVNKTPNNIAVTFNNRQLTYHELNQRANQLAHFLRFKGIEEEDLVALSVERSIEMIVGILAILKAGGVYVPLDPSLPEKRLNGMLENTGGPIVLTQSHLAKQFSQYLNNVIFLDEDWKEILSSTQKLALRTGILPNENPISITKPHHLVNGLYTSGSTGNPKCVLNVHEGLVNRIVWMQNQYQLTQRDKVLHKTPLSFDVAGWEFFWTLTTGAEMVIAPPEAHKDPDKILDLIQTHQISVIHFVPPMLSNFLEVDGVSHARSLRMVFVSGDALSFDLQQRFFDVFSVARLINLYGPTEASIDVSYWECQRQSTSRVVPIGRPIANMQLYVLDNHLEPVPIGGIGLAKGYLNHLELTAEKFIPNPFVSADELSRGKNLKLYKTGDLSKFLPDGNIEYLGRTDFQVKIGGQRIELGEIEALISQHPAIKDVVVVVREDTPQDKRIVAYMVAKEHKTDTQFADELIKALLQKLMKQLPSYMLPSHFMLLESLPLSNNGKVDRKTLPVPDSRFQLRSREYIAPSNKRELKLVKIWAEVLNLQEAKISINDNFFDLGGRSLLAITLLSRIKQEFQKKIELQKFLQSPTIASIAILLDESLQLSDELDIGQSILCLQPKGNQPPLILVHALWGLIKYERGLGEYLPNQPLYGISNPKLGETKDAFKSIEEMATYYVKMLKKVVPAKSYRLGGWSFGGTIAFEMANQLLKKDASSVESVVLLDAYNLSIIIEHYRKLNKQHTLLSTEIIKSLLENEGIDPVSEMGVVLTHELINNMNISEQYRPSKTTANVILMKAGMKLKDIKGSEVVVDPFLTNYHEQPYNGWEDYVETAKLKVYFLPDNDHISMFVSKDNIQLLAETIAKALLEVSKKDKSSPALIFSNTKTQANVPFADRLKLPLKSKL